MNRLGNIVVACSLVLTGTTALTSAAFAENPMVGGAPMLESRNIIENAVNSNDNKTLVAAVKAAGLVDTLSGPGPFTVLAPTDEAFAALPAGTVDDLLKPENKDMLVKVLTCHVIPAKAMSSDIMSMIADDGGTHEVTTVGGCKLQLKVDGDMVTVTDETGATANVTIADVVQSNGVIHVIDKVLLPGSGDAAMADDAMSDDTMAAAGDNMADDTMGNPMVGGAAMYPTKNIIENAVNSNDNKTLVAAVKAAGLVDTLSGPGPFTVLAPTDEAFAALPAGTVDDLLKPENKDMLVKVLTCHVIPAKALSSDIMSMVADDGGTHEVTTVGGCKLQLKVNGDMVTVTDETGATANVTIADVVQSNGVIHVIDKVLLPGSGDAAMADDAMSDDAMADENMAAAGDNMAMEGDFPMVGGAPMLPTKNIIENAVNSADHTTLVAAVKAAGLVEALSGTGPFTVFAPTNEAFAALPDGTVDNLLKPENKDMLTKVLTAHVVSGKLTAADLMEGARANGGRYNLETLSGDPLTAVIKGDSLYMFDESGGAGKITIADVNQSNGVIHVVDAVLVPK